VLNQSYQTGTRNNKSQSRYGNFFRLILAYSTQQQQRRNATTAEDNMASLLIVQQHSRDGVADHHCNLPFKTATATTTFDEKIA
jgi:hypothetical protein